MEYFIHYPKVTKTVIAIDSFSAAVKLCRILKQFGFKTKGKFKKNSFTGKIAMDIKKYEFAQVNKNFKFYGDQMVIFLSDEESIDLLIPDLQEIMKESIMAYKIKSIDDQFKQFIDKPTKIVETYENSADYWYSKPGGWWSTK